MIGPTTGRGRDQRSLILLLFLLRSLFGLGLIVLSLLILVSFLTPQLPPYLTQPHEIDAWLLATRREVPLSTLWQRLGLFAVTRSPAFQGTVLFSLWLAWLHAFYALYLGLWPASPSHIPPVSPIAAEGGRVFQLNRNIDDVLDHVRAWASAHGLVVEEHPSYQESRFFTRLGRGGAYGSALFFLGVVLFLGGLFWGTTRGWTTPPIVLSPGQPWDIGHDTGVRVTLRGEGTTANGHASTLFLIEVHGQKTQTTVRAIPRGEAILVAGVSLRYLKTSLGVRVSASDPAGTPVPIQTPQGIAEREAILQFPTSGTERSVFLPMQGLQVRVVGYTALPERGYSGPVFLVQVLADGKSVPEVSTFLKQNTMMKVGGLQIHIDLVHQAQVQAAHYPGGNSRLAGTVLTLLGALIAIMRGPLQRVWIQVVGHETLSLAQVWGEQYNLGWHRPLEDHILEEQRSSDGEHK